MAKRMNVVMATALGAVLAGGLMLAGIPGAAQAASWDGGIGTWSTTVGMWDGGNVWVQNDPAVFGGTAGTVTLGEDINAASIALNSNNYIIDLAGFNLTNAGNTSFALATAQITNTSGTTATFTTGQLSNVGPLLSGNMNVTYNGGAWTPNINHDFTGTLRLVGTGIVLSNGTALGSDTGLIQLGGTHTLQIGTANSVLSRTFNRNIELLNNTTSFATGGPRFLTLAGDISGTGQLRMSATQGGLILAGNNSYSGNTYVMGAGLYIIAASDTAFGNSALIDMRAGEGSGTTTASGVGFQGNVNIGSTAAINLAGANPASGLGAIHNFGDDNTFAGAITNASNIARLYSAALDSSLTLNGVIGGGKGLVKMGPGTIVLGAANTYGTANASAGNETEIKDGILRLDFSQASAPLVDIVNNNNATNGNQVTHLVLAGGTLELKGDAGEVNSQRFKNATTANSFRVNTGASSVNMNLNGATSLSLNTGRLMEANREVGGTVNFTLPAGTSVVMGTAATGSVGATNAILLANGAAFATVSGTDWASMNASREVISGATVGGFYTANTASTLSGNADMSGGVDTTLAADATTTSVRFNDAAARSIDATGQALTTGGILLTSNVGNNISTITGGTLRGADSAGGTLQDLVFVQNNTANKLVVESTISNAANTNATGLTKTGAGTLELASANTYTGTTFVTGGSLVLRDASALGTGNLKLHGGVIGLTAESGSFTRALGTGAGQVHFLGSGGFAAYGGDRIVDIGGAGGTHLWGSTSTTTGLRALSTLILSAPDADGTLIWQNPINLLATNSDSVPVNRVIRVDDGSATVDARLMGVISNAAGLTKIGAGTLEVMATNTYLGPTDLMDGILLVTGSLQVNSVVTVNSGATLGGIGTVNGTVTLNDGATISPGASIESLDSGSNIWLGDDTFVFEFSTDGSTGAAGSEWDLLAITGGLDLTGATSVTMELLTMLNATVAGPLASWDPLLDHTWAGFVTTTTGVTGYDAGLFAFDTSGFQNALSGSFSVAHNGNNLDLVYTAVIPEPASLALAAMGGLLLLRRRSGRTHG
ncbi:MAG: autotransporter-associated beta strand repeat-containing protein [Phycisphaeraceae bacterium]